jgi:hypothetical protein
MTQAERNIAVIIIGTLAILSQAIWLYEINGKIGWQGTTWLKRDLYSPFLICLFVAMSYIAPFWVRYQKLDARLILTLLTFYMINLSCYLLSKVLFKGLEIDPTPLLKILGILVFIIFAGGYYYVTNELIMPIQKRMAALFALSILLMYFLSKASILVFKGFGTETQWVDAVKMGYPQFWISILLAVSGSFLVLKAED